MENMLSKFLDSVLGSSEKGSTNNRRYKCINPSCPSLIRGKKKLEVCIETDSNGCNPYNCWVCGEIKGKTIKTLLRKAAAPKEAFTQLKRIIKPKDDRDEVEVFTGLLPEEYLFLPDAKPSDIIARHARHYLKQRGITFEDVIKYQIGFCDEGDYSERIIIPSYDANGNMNFFVARSFDPEVRLKYKYPKASRDIIPFEMMINWEVPIVLCEGVFDMIAIKRNCIPLLGKSITPNLMKKIISSHVKKIYIAMDNDALKASLKHCETFIANGLKTFLVELPEKDPSEMGFEAFTQLIQTAEPLTLSKIMKLKIQNI